jgi:hypothetical protein
MGVTGVSAIFGHGEGPPLGLSYDCDSATGWEARGTGEAFWVEAWTGMSMRLWLLRVANENAILPLPGKLFARNF